ncbi:ketoacyl-ACP synthase III [Actinospica durhamensis]|uniref:Ketoacyl-ACP synthase III n=1 Tax=Actinospica durhamensis TaxID=1508375 RepID=A0A941ILC9_9ACTN|nr:ketoacyl-ACP synthase III [Actinospica durhamensis]MBR7832860.1 ketoacyl-ACP synthase III [Actinospica durhamensis]
MTAIAQQQPIGILGTGSYLPARVVSNTEIAGPAGVDAQWIERKTGIRARHRAAPDQATSDLAAEAGRRALAAAGVSAHELTTIVVATSTPDQPQPATASFVQHLLGADQAAAVDVNAVCSGFVYALAMAGGLLRSAAADGLALVIGADVYSRILDYQDRKTAILFGDGAGAVVLGPAPRGRGLYAGRLRGFGAEHGLIGVEAGGSRRPASEGTVREGGHYFRMDGRGVREFVAAQVPKLVHGLLDEARLRPEELRHLVPHQANGVMLRELADLLELPDTRMHLNVEHYGNTGAASIPIALDEAWRAEAIGAGESVLLAGFGGGMNCGLALLER